ncbi:BLUF domain-containing protein [Zobellia nedashkovskayae]
MALQDVYFFFKERFIQYIEGEEIVVRELFDRIKNDDRHSEVTLILRK